MRREMRFGAIVLDKTVRSLQERYFGFRPGEYRLILTPHSFVHFRLRQMRTGYLYV